MIARHGALLALPGRNGSAFVNLPARGMIASLRWVHPGRDRAPFRGARVPVATSSFQADMRTVEEEESELEYERRVMREMNNIMFPPKQPTEPMNFWARLRRNISPGTAASLLCLMGSGYCMYLAGEGQVFATAIAWSTLLVTAATIIIEFFAKVQESLRQVPRVAWVAISNSETRLKKHISKQMSDLEIRLENKINNKTFENENKGLTP